MKNESRTTIGQNEVREIAKSTIFKLRSSIRNLLSTRDRMVNVKNSSITLADWLKDKKRSIEDELEGRIKSCALESGVSVTVDANVKTKGKLKDALGRKEYAKMVGSLETIYALNTLFEISNEKNIESLPVLWLNSKIPLKLQSSNGREYNVYVPETGPEELTRAGELFANQNNIIETLRSAEIPLVVVDGNGAEVHRPEEFIELYEIESSYMKTNDNDKSDYVTDYDSLEKKDGYDEIYDHGVMI